MAKRLCEAHSISDSLVHFLSVAIHYRSVTLCPRLGFPAGVALSIEGEGGFPCSGESAMREKNDYAVPLLD